MRPLSSVSRECGQQQQNANTATTPPQPSLGAEKPCVSLWDLLFLLALKLQSYIHWCSSQYCSAQTNMAIIFAGDGFSGCPVSAVCSTEPELQMKHQRGDKQYLHCLKRKNFRAGSTRESLVIRTRETKWSQLPCPNRKKKKKTGRWNECDKGWAAHS